MIPCGCTIKHKPVTVCGCECHGEQRRVPLTPAEVADLAIIKRRALADRGDIRPMLHVMFDEEPSLGAYGRRERVIPWLEALNMELA